MTEERRHLDLPDRRKNTYEALSNRLDQHVRENEDRLARWIRRGLVAFSIIAIATAVALVGFGIALHRIRENRELFVRSACEATNQRHDGAVAALKLGSDVDQANAPNAAARREIRRRRDVTISLIDALAPVEDCDYLVDLALGNVTPTPTPSPIVPPEETP